MVWQRAEDIGSGEGDGVENRHGKNVAVRVGGGFVSTMVSGLPGSVIMALSARGRLGDWEDRGQCEL